MMTDEDKEATIKNGRGLFSDGTLWARARRRARNGEKGGMDRQNGVGGHPATGRACENKMGGSYFWPHN